MTLDPRHLELMHAVLDGEATPEEAGELDRLLEADAAARAEFDALRQLFARLEGLPRLDPPPGLGEAAWAQRQLSRSRRVLVVPREDRTMNQPSKKRSLWIGAGVAAAAALSVAYLVVGFPPRGDGAAGTVTPAQRYRAEQPKAEDVKLGDQTVAQFMQTEAFERIVKDPQLRALAVDAGFQALAQHPRALAAMAQNPDVFIALARQANAQSADALKADAKQADALKADALKADALKADAKQADALRADALRAEAIVAHATRAEALRADALKADAKQAEALRADALKADALRADALKAEALRASALRAEAAKASALRADALRAEALRAEAVSLSPEAMVVLARSPNALQALSKHADAFAALARQPNFAALAMNPSFAQALQVNAAANASANAIAR